MKQITLIIALNICFFSFGQSLIKGTISDESGPLAGANIIIKNTTHGVATDFEGKFAITASTKDTLVISFMGYRTKEISVGDKSFINISLEGSICLDEVIVNAYNGKTQICTISCGWMCTSTSCGVDIVVKRLGNEDNSVSRLFPNPSSNGLFHLKFNETYHKVEINVATMTGQMVKNIQLHKVEGNMDIDLSNLTSGIYIVNILADGKRLKPQKAIKG